MAEEQNPYLAVLADLERDRDQINAMIAMMRKRAGLSAEEVPSAPLANGSNSQPSDSTEIRSDTFFGMVISDAIKKYLGIVKRPKKTTEIAKALEEGGLQHTSKRWFATVQTTLNRMHGVIVKLPNGWGLLEWYPGRNFDKKAPAKKNKRKRVAKTSTKGNTAAPRSGQPLAAPAGDALATSRELQGRYLAVLKKFPKERRGPYQEIAKRDGRNKAIKAMEDDLLSASG